MGGGNITDLEAKNQQINEVVAALLHEQLQLKEELEGPQKWAKRDSNPRHLLCKSSALTN